MRNPVVGLETVAVAPFFNLSQERTVDGREFAIAYYSELQKVPGFEVLPVGVTERAMVENGISLTGPEDAIRLAKILDVDAVVVGAVTDYDPYNPRIGLKVAWYSPRQWLFLPNEDPTVPFFNRSADAPVKQPGRPTYGTPRAQSPDDSDQWRSDVASQAVMVEEGNWQRVTSSTNAENALLADAGLPKILPILPDGTSLLVPAGDASFPKLPLPAPVTVPEFEEWPSETVTINYQEIARPAAPIPAPAAEELIPVQGSSAAPPVEFRSPASSQTNAPSGSDSATPAAADPPSVPADSLRTTSPLAAEPALSGNPSSNTAPRLFPQPVQPDSKPSPRQPAVGQSEGDNPFNRHVPVPPTAVDIHDSPDQSTSEISKRPLYQEPPRVAATEPEFPRPGQKGAASPQPPEPAPLAPESLPAATAPTLTTPLFPVPRPEMVPVPEELPPAMAPALVYGEHVVVPPADFEVTEPLMAYVRLFDATDRRLIARLSDYLELTGQLRSGDLEAYMKRSEFFRKFTAHVMISEMLQLHGGEARRQLVLKPRKYR